MSSVFIKMFQHWAFEHQTTLWWRDNSWIFMNLFFSCNLLSCKLASCSNTKWCYEKQNTVYQIWFKSRLSQHNSKNFNLGKNKISSQWGFVSFYNLQAWEWSNVLSSQSINPWSSLPTKICWTFLVFIPFGVLNNFICLCRIFIWNQFKCKWEEWD